MTVSIRIKKAYRKKALELHPDRNYGNVEEATKLFAEVQSAYEVLADPQERAWYDSHSDAFLGTAGNSEGAQHSYNVRITTAEDVLRLFSKFSPRMDFSDSPTGFFGGLREQFAQLALEESIACQWENQDVVDYPSFGGRNDDFEDVVRPFYAVWSSFATRKSFAWKDAYRYSEAPDRRVRRLMEKENRRLRDEGIREFNDAVRSLVAFVKKRDPRYKSNAQSEAQRQETLRQSVAAQAAKSRAVNQAKMRDHVTPEWARSQALAEEDDEESSEGDIERFECVACHKQFKSQKQFEAHERSKKHLKAVKQLCREMRMQNDQLDLGSSPTRLPEASIDNDTPISTQPTSEPDDVLSDEEARDSVSVKSGDQRSRVSGAQEISPSRSASRSPLGFDGDEDEDDDDDYAPREVIETWLYPDTFDTTAAEDSTATLSEQLSSTCLEDATTPAAKLGKAKQKRAKKAAQRTVEQSTGMVCARCDAVFPSRTRLFAHIKEFPDHAQPISRPPGTKGMKKR